MKSKAARVVLDVIVSVIVFGATAVLATEVFSWILGTSKDASGQEKVHGGYAVTAATIAVCLVLSIVFARWFYGLLSKRSKSTGADANVGE